MKIEEIKKQIQSEYTSAQLATDGVVYFDYQGRLVELLRKHGHNVEEYFSKPERLIDLRIIESIIARGGKPSQVLEDISAIYPRSLMMHGMQRKGGQVVWARFVVHGTQATFEVGAKQ